jgi:ADP-ribose pyrophosphatase YjhB (NUDIX family)
MEITRHFTATTFVVYQGRTLLHKHRTLGIWLPPGGHIDRDELPEVAAVREVLEETGLEVELIHDPPVIASDNARELPRPWHILLENINPFHQHIDLIYFARAPHLEIIPEEAGIEMRWFSVQELDEDHIPEDIKILGLEAIEVAGEPEKASQTQLKTSG